MPLPARSRALLLLTLLLPLVVLASACSPPQDAAPTVPPIPFDLPVVVVKFFPVAGDSIDRATTGDWGRSLAFTRTKTDSATVRLIRALEEGTRFHGYKGAQAPASLSYRVLETYEFLEPLPTVARPGREVPMTDYRGILTQIEAERWVTQHGVKEFWIWGYHGGVLDLWESNMAGPYGDVSNSDRDTTDLPVFGSTYTVYHYNYQRGVAEAAENHMHQLEAVLNAIDGRDTTAAIGWPNLLFWGKFVGSDSTHRIVPPARAGWSHYPPNAVRDYDWANRDTVLTDIEAWQPDGPGPQHRLNCEAWACDHLGWFIYWTQNMPGHENGLTYQGKPLHNWWRFLGDYDGARALGLRLSQ